VPLTIPNIPVGGFTLRAFFPGKPSIFTDVGGAILANGDVVPMTVTLPPFGTVSGTVTFPDGSPASGAEVDLLSNDSFIDSTVTAANGTYTFTSVRGNVPLTIQAFNPDFETFTIVSNKVITVDGQTLTVNAVLPAIATLHLTVLKADLTPFGGSQINLSNAFNPRFSVAGITASNGVLDIPDVPEGEFLLQALDPVSFLLAGSASGTILSSDHGHVVNAIIHAAPTGTVRGTVVAADGATPIPGIFVSVVDALTQQFLASRATDTNGFYEASGIPSRDGGFQVIASAPNPSTAKATNSGAITTQGQIIVANLTLNVSILRGRVFQTNGASPVSFPLVRAFQTNQSGVGLTFFPTRITADGDYVLVGLDARAFQMLAGDQQQTRLAVITNGSIASITTPATFDVVIGGAALLPFNLDGADGFRYDLDCAGSIVDGGRADGSITPSYGGPNYSGGQQLYVADASL